MKTKKAVFTTSSTLSAGLAALLTATALTLAGCSTVRDATDWVPGVDSNEEIQAEKDRQAKEAQKKAREAYEDKAVFDPSRHSASEADARINVVISQKYAENELVNREDIGIEVNAGVVTLTGSVDSDDSAVKAISLAKSTTGVSRVVSKLVVIKVRTN